MSHSFQIDEGAYSCVYKIPQNPPIVCKQYKDITKQSILIEYVIARTLAQHPLIGHIDQWLLTLPSPTCYLVMPYYPYSLTMIPVTTHNMMHIAHQLLTAANYLASQGIIHRDLKPGNILLDNNGYIKVIDFNLSCFQQTHTSHPPGSLWYTAPEILQIKPYGCRADLWSIGCIMFELIVDRPCFKGRIISDVLCAIDQYVKSVKRFNEEIRQYQSQNLSTYQPRWPSLKHLKHLYTFDYNLYQLVVDLLKYNPQKRSAASELLRRPFFKHFTPIHIDIKQQSIVCDPLSEPVHIQIPELSIDIYKHHSSCRLSPRSSTPIYVTYNTANLDEQLIYDIRDMLSYHQFQTSLKICLSLVRGIFFSLDMLIQCLVLVTRCMTIPQIGHNIMSDLCQVSYDIVSQIFIDPPIPVQWTPLHRLVIDMCGPQLTQNRQIYYSGHNLRQMGRYNVIYNCLYLLEPSIRQYQYNYVVAQLQILLHSPQRTILPQMAINNDIHQCVKQFVMAGWSCIATTLGNDYLPVMTIYKWYVRRYKANRK